MRRKRILIGAIAGVTGGPRTYAVALAEALAAAETDLDLIWLSEVLPDRGTASRLRRRRLHLAHPVLRPLWDHVAVPRAIRRLGVDLYHNTKNALPLSAPVPTVVTIHDLAPFRLPETFSRPSRAYLTFHMAKAVSSADRIIVVSESTKRDVVEILSGDEGRIDVVQNGIDERFRDVPDALVDRARAAYELSRPYVLSAGTIQPRKNPDVVLRAFLDLPASIRNSTTLVFAGRRGWKCGHFFEELEDARRNADVRHLAAVPDQHMPGLIAGAAVFTSPSSYEGFGLAVAEAMAAGTPVIAGDASSLPEVVGDAGILVPPKDVAALREALSAVLEDEEMRRDLGESARRRARRFTWKRAAAETARTYRRVLQAES